MLTAGIQKRIELEHEPGAWVTVRMLGYRALEAAREARTARAIRRARDMGPELMASLPRGGGDGLVLETDPLEEYDLNILLQEGIVAWSYAEPVNAETIGSLDEATAKVVARALLPQAETETARGNGLPRSTRRSTA